MRLTHNLLTMRKLFGTDGVRGVANSELTAELALQLGRAAAIELGGSKLHPHIVFGRDTRLSGDMLEAALAAGALSAGAHVLDGGVLPTPAVAFLTTGLGRLPEPLSLPRTTPSMTTASSSSARMATS